MRYILESVGRSDMENIRDESESSVSERRT